jgi:hypothetical protein
MCGRYYRRSDKQRIAEAFQAKGGIDDLVLPDWNYNVAPSTLDPTTFQPSFARPATLASGRRHDEVGPGPVLCEEP